MCIVDYLGMVCSGPQPWTWEERNSLCPMETFSAPHYLDPCRLLHKVGTNTEGS